MFCIIWIILIFALGIKNQIHQSQLMNIQKLTVLSLYDR